MKFAVTLLALVFISSCADESDEVTKDDVMGIGKADSAALDRLCIEAGQPQGCDICLAMGWYTDDVCDDFCAEFDTACASGGTCSELMSTLEFCFADLGVEECMAYHAEEYDQAITCCDEFPHDVCGVVFPEEGTCSELMSTLEFCFADLGVEECMTYHAEEYDQAIACCGAFPHDVCGVLLPEEGTCSELMSTLEFCFADLGVEECMTYHAEDFDLMTVCCDTFPHDVCSDLPL